MQGGDYQAPIDNARAIDSNRPTAQGGDYQARVVNARAKDELSNRHILQAKQSPNIASCVRGKAVVERNTQLGCGVDAPKLRSTLAKTFCSLSVVFGNLRKHNINTN
jgi:hypothetical protein